MVTYFVHYLHRYAKSCCFCNHLPIGTSLEKLKENEKGNLISGSKDKIFAKNGKSFSKVGTWLTGPLYYPVDEKTDQQSLCEGLGI